MNSIEERRLPLPIVVQNRVNECAGGIIPLGMILENIAHDNDIRTPEELDALLQPIVAHVQQGRLPLGGISEALFRELSGLQGLEGAKIRAGEWVEQNANG